MKDNPNCKICKLKCCGCQSYETCLMRKGENGHKIEDCTFMASKYYLFGDYLSYEKGLNMRLCNYDEVCKSLVDAWM